MTPLADDPAIIIYTSGTTGPPKGALHAHRFLLGHMPGVLLPQSFPPQPGDIFWTPADWAWIGGLYDVLFPAWHWGLPVLAHRARKFDPERALDLMARHAVRNVFLPPTALKMIRRSGARPGPDLRLRSVASGGETLGAELLDWGRDVLGTTINEFYGQTECNLVISNSDGIMPIRPGSMGRAVPGHEVAIIDDDGAPVAAGVVGEIAVARPDPVMFLGYWNRPEATLAKFSGDWLRTGDRASMDDDGYVWYQARNDDVITSGGYRIGPGEIEDCLIRHPAVAMVAVVGIPDADRTEIVKAFVVPAPGTVPSPELTAELQAFVRERLAAHEYPRAIDYLAELPLTATGKVMRRELARPRLIPGRNGPARRPAERREWPRRGRCDDAGTPVQGRNNDGRARHCRTRPPARQLIRLHRPRGRAPPADQRRRPRSTPSTTRVSGTCRSTTPPTSATRSRGSIRPTSRARRRSTPPRRASSPPPSATTSRSTGTRTSLRRLDPDRSRRPSASQLAARVSRVRM